MNDELKEAIDVLRVIGGFSEPTRYRTYKLFEDEAAAILAHIESLKDRNHDLELRLTDPSAYDCELTEAKKRIAELEEKLEILTDRIPYLLEEEE